jgi:hypothetical protein
MQNGDLVLTIVLILLALGITGYIGYAMMKPSNKMYHHPIHHAAHHHSVHHAAHHHINAASHHANAAVHHANAAIGHMA